MTRIIESIASFDAKPRVIGGTVASLNVKNAVVLDVIGQLATHAAVGAQRFDRFVRHGQRDFARRHQRTRGTGLHALAASHAGGGAHGIVHVENDLGVLAARGQADHIVHLFITAGAHAACTLDTGIEVDRHRRVRQVRLHRGTRRETRLADLQFGRPLVDLVVARVFPLRHVGLQQLNDHLLRLAHAFVVGGHLHTGRGRTATGSREHPLAFDFNHAGAAIADRFHSFLVAKPRNFDALAIGDLDQSFAGQRRHFAAVQQKGNGGGLGLPANVRGRGAHALYLYVNSFGKYLMTVSTGFGAACPNPQIDASRMTWDSSASSGLSQSSPAMSALVLAVPTRQGVH